MPKKHKKAILGPAAIYAELGVKDKLVITNTVDVMAGGNVSINTTSHDSEALASGASFICFIGAMNMAKMAHMDKESFLEVFTETVNDLWDETEGNFTVPNDSN